MTRGRSRLDLGYVSHMQMVSAVCVYTYVGIYYIQPITYAMPAPGRGAVT